MYLERHKYMGIAVIKLSGVLASENSQRAKNALDRLIPRSGKALLDLTKMSYLSSAGLRVLELACRRAEALGAVIVLTVPDEIREAMVATGFLDRFTVTGTVSDGIDALDRMGRRPNNPHRDPGRHRDLRNAPRHDRQACYASLADGKWLSG